MIWKVMRRNAWKEIPNRQTKQLISFTKSQHHALTTTTSRKKWVRILSKLENMLEDSRKDVVSSGAWIREKWYGTELM